MRALFDIPAPAKLNLFLHVTGRRPDGYHLLQSVFMLIDWHDVMHLERREDGRLSREDIGQPVPPEDLVLRAARALQKATGCTMGVHVVLDKRLPVQAGMGGGSSDAASCLLALNRLWRTGLDSGQLARIGLGLGADIPFFVRGRNAWVEGIGEQITPIDVPVNRFVVVKPPAGVDTATIFRSPMLRRDSEPATIAGFAANPLHFGRNDLQAVARCACPEVGGALDWLADQGLAGRMTGSGSAVFAPLPSGHVLDQAPPDWTVRVCGSLEAHPMFGWAPSDDSRVDRLQGD